jgi:N-acetylneuraminic acid mutarotase
MLMSWPLSQDYNEAVQSPARNFSDPDLSQGKAVTNALGIPMPCSGNFADVYQVRCPDGSCWAVKCFTRETPGLRERYQAITRHLVLAKLPFMVEFSYLDPGIRVAGKWYPVLKMQWVEGLTLNQFVAQNLDKPAALDALLQVWPRMAKALRAAQVGHCDLQHGNVLLVPGASANSLTLKLIDYDGMWVPGLAGTNSSEVGHASYQHPQRQREGTYSIDVDRFSLLLIATGLSALKTGGRALWEKYDDGDNLLFRQPDLEAPHKSRVFYDLLKLDDPATRSLTETLIEATRQPLEETPLLEDVIPDARPSPTPPKPETVSPPPVRGAKSITPSPRSSKERSGEASSYSQRRRNNARLWIALAGAVGLLALIVGVIALLVVNNGLGDSKKGQALAQGGGVSTPGRADVSTSRRADVTTGKVIPPGDSPKDVDKPKDTRPDLKNDKTDTPEKPATAIPSAKMFPGLLAYWPFDEGEGDSPTDVSSGVRGKGHHIEWVDGVRGKAIHTKGKGSYFDFSAHPKLNFAVRADFTFCGWVRTRQKEGTLLSNRADADSTPDIDLHVNSGALSLYVRSAAGYAPLKGEKVVSDGAWHHFAFTRQGADVALYIDGTLETWQQNTLASGAIATDLRALGAELYWLKDETRLRDGLDTDYLAGDFDEFCVFGRALSAAEIGTLAGKKPPDPVDKPRPPDEIRPTTWKSLANMPTARSLLATVTGPDGRIYAIGGEDASGRLNTVEVYDPSTDKWSTVASMPTARNHLAATMGPNNLIYAIGGVGGGNNVEAYNSKTNKWTTVAPMPTARHGLAAVTGPDGRIYAIGGSGPSGVVNTVEAYDTKSNTWATVATMPTARTYLAAATGPDGRIYAIGGFVEKDSKRLNTVEAYDTKKKTWTAVASMTTARNALAAVAGADGRIYAIGGHTVGEKSNIVEAYNPSTDKWTPVANMPTARGQLAAATGRDGRIFVIGGGNVGFLDTVEALSLSPSK